MKQLLSKGLAGVALAMCMVAMPIHASADKSVIAAAPAIAEADPGIEGTWFTRVQSATQGVFYSMTTFGPGGHVVEENSSSSIRSVGQGEWIRLGPRAYMRVFYYFVFDSPRVFARIAKVINFITLNDAGDEYDADTVTESFDPNGVLSSTNYSTSHARRCPAWTPLPECLGR